MPETRINTGFPKHFCCSRPTKNHPLVYPKIDLPGREKTKPLSLFIAAILQHSLLYSTFSFRIQWPLRLSLPPSLFCLCSIQQSHLSLINQAVFLFSCSFSGLKRMDWVGLELGCVLGWQRQKKKQDQTNFFEIHQTLLHVFYVLFHLDTWMSLSGTRTNPLFKLDNH